MGGRSFVEWWDDLSGRVLEYATTGSDRLTSLLIKIFERLPPGDAEILLHERDVRFICPQACSVRSFHVYKPIEEGKDHTESVYWFVFLTTNLVELPEKEAMYLIVHELAHVFFEEESGTHCTEGELKADRQVEVWGFKKELKSVTYNYLYGTGLKRFEKVG